MGINQLVGMLLKNNGPYIYNHMNMTVQFIVHFLPYITSSVGYQWLKDLDE